MRTRVYKNLNNGKWSLKQKVDGKWRVVGHCDACVLEDVYPYVSEKSRQRLLPKRQREVHAWLEGDLMAEPTGFVPFKRPMVQPLEHRGFAWDMLPEWNVHACAKVTYHPFEHGDFFYTSTGLSFEYAEMACFAADVRVC